MELKTGIYFATQSPYLEINGRLHFTTNHLDVCAKNKVLLGRLADLHTEEIEEVSKVLVEN